MQRPNGERTCQQTPAAGPSESMRTGSTQVTGHGLVLPTEPVDDTRALAAAYARYLAACCQKFLTVGSKLAAALRPAHASIAALVRQALVRRQRQMLNCFASPMVGTALHCVELRDDMEAFQARIDKAAEEMMPHLLLEMALRRLIPDGQSVLWEHGAPRLASLAIGGELIPPVGSTGLRFCASHISAIAGGAEVARLPVDPETMHRALAGDSPGASDGEDGFRFERRYWRTGNVTRFATIDHNPIAAFEAHPDKAGNHIDLGGHSEQEWIGVLDECCALIGRFMPGELAEMAIMLHEFIPVGYHVERHLSASYREAIGTVYLTLHPNVMTMTEAVVHEFQHNKLNVSAHSVEYLRNAFHPLYKSPVRPDPRPLWGILLAVHAFLPVAELYRRMRDAGHPLAARPEFEQRLSEIDLKNHEGMEMLRAHAQLTPAGRALFDELEAMERRHLAERSARGLENTATESHLG
jgi:HEXXH motif-containing protein